MAPSDVHTLGDLLVALYRALTPVYGRIVANVGAVYVIQLCHDPKVGEA
jgi:uncharacterized membrane protein